MKKFFSIALIGLVLNFHIALATNSLCKYYAFLKPGFNMSNYQSCQVLIKQCSKKNLSVDQSCIEKLTSRNMACQQFNQLADAVQMPITALKITQAGQFNIVDKIFSADGQHQYYLITPTGCLLDTRIDPRKLSASLANQYKNVDFIFVNTEQPSYSLSDDGNHHFSLKFTIAKNCLACERVGNFSLHFEFNSKGNLQAVSVNELPT